MISYVNHSLELQKAEIRHFPLSVVFKWVRFIEKMQGQLKGIPKPAPVVQTLVQKYLNHSTLHVLDVGCETGKNAMCLIEAGHRVVLLDIAPNAIQYTLDNLKANGMVQGVAGVILVKIEDLEANKGPFKAIVSTSAFSFIPPELFDQTMRETILDQIESGGYFAARFFGKDHAWADNPMMTFLSVSQIKSLFDSVGYAICEINEKKEMYNTVFTGQKRFHIIDVIAKKLNI